MTQFEANKKAAKELKGHYVFTSPYHKTKKMLPFVVTGCHSFNDDYPIEVRTVEYKGWSKREVNASYKAETIKEWIETGFLIKSN